MEREIVSIKRKALKINLDNSIYGTFAEIGAGQEVVRTFFQVGGASATIAKSMSAYDMTYSDAIYGPEEKGRYVSESRLKKMLQHEWELIEERLVSDKYAQDRFFTFADTCTTINYLKNNDPHCWMGIRFQSRVDGPINEIMMHIRLKENDALLQQRTIGAFGVNLIYACFFYDKDIDAFIESLFDNLSKDQAEIDMLRIKGEDFNNIDNRLVALTLVKKGFTRGTIFGPDKEVYQPKDLLYKKNVLCYRGRFRPMTKLGEDMYRTGFDLFKKIAHCDSELIGLSEITLNNLETDAGFSDKDFIDRTEILCNLGYTVLISNSHKHDTLISYLKRCNTKCIGIIIGMMNLMDLFNPEKYENPERELLQYFGEIFNSNSSLLVYPFRKDGKIVTLKNYKPHPSLIKLYEYLCDNEFLLDIENYNEEVLSIFSDKIIYQIKSGESGWEDSVPASVAQFIKDNCLFDYPCEIK